METELKLLGNRTDFELRGMEIEQCFGRCCVVFESKQFDIRSYIYMTYPQEWKPLAFGQKAHAKHTETLRAVSAHVLRNHSRTKRNGL